MDDEVGECQVRPGTLDDVEAAAAVLAQAFADSPWTQWTVDPERHIDRIAALQRLVMERAVLPFGELWVASVDTEVVGAALLNPVLRRADDESVDVYLETSTETNVAFYAALDFVVTGEHQIPDGGPHVRAMSRVPLQS